MKCRCFAAALITLIPAPARGQNPQFTNCRSLELTGNFVAADEVLVNGQVCKVAGQKNSAANSTAAPEKAVDKSKALLGIVEPETLRAKEKTNQGPPPVSSAPSGLPQPVSAGGVKTKEKSSALLGIIEPETLREKPAANSPSGTTLAGPNPAPAASGTAQAGQPESFAMVPQGSLGAIARAYRKEAPPRANADQAGIMEKKRTPQAESKVATMETSAAAAPVVETAPAPNVVPSTATLKTAQPQEIVPAASAPNLTVPAQEAQTAKSNPSVAAPVEPVVATPDAAPAVATAPPVAPAVKAEAHRSSVTTPPLVEPKPEKMRVSPEVLPVQPPSNPEVNTPAAMPAPTPSAPPQEAPQVDTGATANPATPAQPEVSPPQLAGLEPEREKATTTAASAVPEEAGANPDAQPAFEGDAELGAFREGQMPNCRKNISLGSLTKENLFLSIPDWAMAWYAKNQKRFPGVCFSNAIMPGAKNFLVVFYTVTPAVTAADTTSPAKAEKGATAELSPAKAEGRFTTSVGSMWHYSVEKEVTTTITSVSADKAPHNQQPAVIFATAYTEQGVPVAQHRPSHPVNVDRDKGKGRAKEPSKKSGKKQEVVDLTSAVMADLLSQMVQDIAKH